MSRDTYILEEAIDTVYDRPDTHGEPEDSFARIADMWSGYFGIEVDPFDVANAMILLKVARSKEGHYHEDNFVDMAGYAENGARLQQEREGEDEDGPTATLEVDATEAVDQAIENAYEDGRLSESARDALIEAGER